MALDRIGLEMIAGRIRGAEILCLGYPDITVTAPEVKHLLGVESRNFTDHGKDHKAAFPLPETLHTLLLAGAKSIHVVDVKRHRGMEFIADLNRRIIWGFAPYEALRPGYDLVINPGTLEHCFDVATATFNAWRAVKVGGALLQVAPLTMVNHGFWNVCPTAIWDFAEANGGAVAEAKARDRNWTPVQVDRAARYPLPADCVLYALVVKRADVPETIPTQRRYQ